MNDSPAQVMGIINTTDDSFHSSSRVETAEAAVRRARGNAGSRSFDTGYRGMLYPAGLYRGGRRNRNGPRHTGHPGHRRQFPGVEISVDTFRALVAEKAADAGATLVNDISGGDFDPQMFPTVARLKLPYILMHTIGMPDNMASHAVYKDVTAEVIAHLEERLARLQSLGVGNVILDPGVSASPKIRSKITGYCATCPGSKPWDAPCWWASPAKA